MQALIQDYPLTVDSIFRRVEKLFPDKSIVTGPPDRAHRTTYGEWAERTRRLGGVLDELGIGADGRVGTFAWNSARHLELYFAVPSSGRVLHTLNIRLFPEQLTYIANHAEDEAIFVDRSLIGVLWPLIDTMTTVKHVVVMDDTRDEIPDDPRIRNYEELLTAAGPVDFHVADEHRAAAMCYTSGTTGHPKGVVYSHRSTWLHSLTATTTSCLGIDESDTVMPVVPMFHANAWGIAQAAPMAGASLVFPGPDVTPAAIGRLLQDEQVTVTAGVPTIWQGLLPLLDDLDLSSLRTVICGGSAVPPALSEAYREQTGKPILHAWGMTETHPLGSICRVQSRDRDASRDELVAIRARQGTPMAGVELRIVETGTTDELPWDDEATGELQVRGAWVASDYYNPDEGVTLSTEDGWMQTGDVAAIDRFGSIRLVDRTKDLVKSGGEWISSVHLENLLMGHPAVAEAAVIGVPHPKWDERPLACVVLKPGEAATAEELLERLRPQVAKWWLPDAVEFVDEVPKTSVGKFSKKTLRDNFAGYRFPDSDD